MNRKLIVSIVALLIVSGLITGVLITKQTATSSQSSQTTSQTEAAPTSNATYKDGTYQATGSYNSPGGKQTLKVQLTVANNQVTDAMVTPSAKDGVAQVYQSYFVNNYKSQVVGKSVGSLKLSRVAGSSLTSKGFNDALEQIKSQAQS